MRKCILLLLAIILSIYTTARAENMTILYPPTDISTITELYQGILLKVSDTHYVYVYVTKSDGWYYDRKVMMVSTINGGKTWSAESQVYDEENVDDHQISGGVTPAGTFVIFLYQRRQSDGKYRGIILRSTNNGASWLDPIVQYDWVAAGNSSIRACFGNMITIDSNKLMQGFFTYAYAFSGGPWDLKVLFSTDDGICNM